MKRSKIAIIILIICILAPLVWCGTLAFGVSGTYEETFLGEMSEKMDILLESRDEKIIVVGGSSVCFGLDSKLIEEKLHKKVVDFGLYATLGTKMMLDLSKANVKNGDIVIIAPELDPQTLSMYFNSEAAWQAIDGDMRILKYCGKDNYKNLAGGFYKYLCDSMKLRRDGVKLDPEGVYNKSSFNSYGDISYARPANKMTVGFDVNQTINLTPDIFEPEFVDYINDYIKWCEKRGAKVYFSYCPMNALALADGTTDDSIFEFTLALSGMLDCEIISNINDYILNSSYFYDTNYHLNDEGAVIRTETLVNDINRVLGNNKDYIVVEKKAAERNDNPADSDVTSDDDFIFTEFGSGYAVSGLTESAKTKTKIDIPREHNGKPVFAVKPHAFKDCPNLTDISIYDNITLLYDLAFECDSLRSVHIFANDSDSVEAGENLFGSSRSNVTIYFASHENYASFVSGYWWAQYADLMAVEG